MSSQSSSQDLASAIPRSASIRRQLLQLLSNMLSFSSQTQLPSPDDLLLESQRQLMDENYILLIGGEAKRGKSSFLNAMIGQELLPTDLGEATSQVFLVRPSTSEGYRLRFEDGSALEIAREDLERYGSQIVQDFLNEQVSGRMVQTPSSSKVAKDRLIRYIEVDVPIRFLPPGMGAMDTPGLGALYPAHAEITYRFIPEADAVVFVIDSEKPVNPAELSVLDDILQYTSDVFFVQTKIDRFTESAWNEVKERSEQLLRERFGSKLSDTRVWPIASPVLLRAANAGASEAMLLKHSRHTELSMALRTFLLRVQGWRRAKSAFESASSYYRDCRQVLASRVSTLLEPSESTRRGHRELALASRTNYEDAWGPNGQRRGILLVELDRSLDNYRSELDAYFSPYGTLANEAKDDVYSASSMDELRRVADRLPHEMAASAARMWRTVCGRISEDYLRLQEPFRRDTEDLVRGPEPLSNSPTNISSAPPMILAGNVGNIVAKSAKRGFFGGAIAGAGLLLLGAAPPLAIAVGVITGLVAWFTGSRPDPNRDLPEAKQRTNQYIDEAVEQIYENYLGDGGEVDSHFEASRNAMTEQLDEVSARRLAESQAEIERAAEQERLNEEQRRIAQNQAQENLLQWDAFQNDLESIGKEIDSLDQLFANSAR